LAAELACELGPRHRVLLEGEMGAGKSTFARALLEGLGVRGRAEGSPTFALMHEYEAPLGAVAHLDLYRVKDPGELAMAGIEAVYWERDALVISEWLGIFPEFERAVVESTDPGTLWRVRLRVTEGRADRRDVEIRRSRGGAG
jgi:tRNA threonylcarbamoyl adenosine modification protein YjeE